MLLLVCCEKLGERVLRAESGGFVARMCAQQGQVEDTDTGSRADRDGIFVVVAWP